jgi:hypothetical protein
MDKRLSELKGIFNRHSLSLDKLLIAGSAPLGVFNIIASKNISDIDVIVRDQDTWDKVKLLGAEQTIKTDGFIGKRVVYKDDKTNESIDFISTWPMAGKSDDKLFEKKMVIDGLSFMSLDHVIRYKLTLDRPKDRGHLFQLRSWLSGNKIDDQIHIPQSVRKRAYRDIARGLASNLSKNK